MSFLLLSFSYSNNENVYKEKAREIIENLDTVEHIYGIDFSHYSGDINWNHLSHDTNEISFIFLRATYGVEVDYRYCDNVEEAICREYITGSYHYFRPNECGDVQAYNYLNTISRSDEHLLPVLDAESSYFDVTDDELRREWKKWLDIVENELCVTPIIYSNLKFWEEHIRDFPEFDRYPLWIAAYPPEKWKDEVMEIAHIYQFSDREQIRGITKKVDGNIISKEKFLRLLP